MNIHSPGYASPSEGMSANRYESSHHFQSHGVQIDSNSGNARERTTWINWQINLYKPFDVQSLPVSFRSVSPHRCHILSNALLKHTLITDLCSRYSYPLARKRSGSVIPLIQLVFIYVIAMASTVASSLSFVSRQKSPYSVHRDWEWDVFQLVINVAPTSRQNKALPLTSYLKHLR